jgi:hypothetical protein
MNQRIKELIAQATKRYEPDWNGAPAYEDFDKEKFAELIIQECIWALWTEECRTSDLASEEYTRGSARINDHFWGC